MVYTVVPSDSVGKLKKTGDKKKGSKKKGRDVSLDSAIDTIAEKFTNEVMSAGVSIEGNEDKLVDNFFSKNEKLIDNLLDSVIDSVFGGKKAKS